MAATKQGMKTITKYANLLQTLWQELDHYQCLKMKCSEDAALHKRFVKKERTYDFLAGLNIEFGAVKVQILGKEEFTLLKWGNFFNTRREKECNAGTYFE